MSKSISEGFLILGLIICLYILLPIWCIYHADNKEEREVTEYKKNFNYDVDSLQKTICYGGGQDFDNNENKLTLPNNQVKGKIVIFGNNEKSEKWFSYEFNKALNQNYIAKDITDLSNVVFVNFKRRQVGEYESGVKAIQNYVVIDFLKKNTNRVESTQILWGGSPPVKVYRRPNGADVEGYTPSTEDIVKTIQEQIYHTEIKKDSTMY